MLERISIIIISALIALPAFAQVDKRDVRRGNRDFGKGNYKEAEIDYRKALVKDSTSLAANYNLASTLYKTKDFEAAAKNMESIKEAASSSEYAADYYFNAGDIALAQKNYSAAVEAFKSSLLLAPDDLKSKENYIYSKKMLENQQNRNNQNRDNKDQNKDQNNDQNQNQDQNNDQDKDNQDNDQNQDRNQNEDQQNNQNKDKPNAREQQPQISPQAAQQMLQAIQEKEKTTQEKVKKEKAAVLKSKQKEKNW